MEQLGHVPGEFTELTATEHNVFIREEFLLAYLRQI